MEAEVAGVSAGRGTRKVALGTEGMRGGARCCPHSPAHRACQPHQGGQRGLADPAEEEEEEEEEVRRGEVSHRGREVALPPPRGVRPLAGRGDPPHLEAGGTSRTLFTSFSSGTLGERGEA